MASRDEAAARKALAWMMEAGRALAKGQRLVVVALTAIEAAKADGYSSNTGYDTAHSGPHIGEDGSINGSTPATLTANDWLLGLEDDILADCKALAACANDLLDLCNRAPGSKDPKAFDRLRCTGGIDPWGDPRCIRMAVTGVGANYVAAKSAHPFPGLCAACDQRRRRYLKAPAEYSPKVDRWPVVIAAPIHELTISEPDPGRYQGSCSCGIWEAEAFGEEARGWLEGVHTTHCLEVAA